MHKPLAGALMAASLLLVAAAPADYAVEAKRRTATMQDDLRRVEKLVQEVAQLSREVENAADRIRGPNDVQDIRIVETKMDELKKKTAEAVGASERVTKLATNLHTAAQDLVDAKGGSRGGQAKPRR